MHLWFARLSSIFDSIQAIPSLVMIILLESLGLFSILMSFTHFSGRYKVLFCITYSCCLFVAVTDRILTSDENGWRREMKTPGDTRCDQRILPWLSLSLSLLLEWTQDSHTLLLLVWPKVCFLVRHLVQDVCSQDCYVWATAFDEINESLKLHTTEGIKGEEGWVRVTCRKEVWGGKICRDSTINCSHTKSYLNSHVSCFPSSPSTVQFLSFPSCVYRCLPWISFHCPLSLSPSPLFPPLIFPRVLERRRETLIGRQQQMYMIRQTEGEREREDTVWVMSRHVSQVSFFFLSLPVSDNLFLAMLAVIF